MKFESLTTVEFEKALVEGKMFYMRKYRYYGQYSASKLVSAEVAEKKSKVRVDGGWRPYDFALAE